MKLQMIGVIPDYLDTKSEIKLDIDRIPFSKYYRTYKDYVNDKLKAFDISNSGREIPDDLFQKLLETRKELEAR